MQKAAAHIIIITKKQAKNQSETALRYLGLICHCVDLSQHIIIQPLIPWIPNICPELEVHTVEKLCKREKDVSHVWVCQLSISNAVFISRNPLLFSTSRVVLRCESVLTPVTEMTVKPVSAWTTSVLLWLFFHILSCKIKHRKKQSENSLYILRYSFTMFFMWTSVFPIVSIGKRYQMFSDRYFVFNRNTLLVKYFGCYINIAVIPSRNTAINIHSSENIHIRKRCKSRHWQQRCKIKYLCFTGII